MSVVNIFRVLVWSVITFCVFASYTKNQNPGFSWITFLHKIRTSFKNCTAKRDLPSESSAIRCLKATSLKSFDELMSSDVIPLTSGIRFVRIPSNVTFTQSGNLKSCFDKHWQVSSNWAKFILTKFSHVFKTHVLQIDVGGLERNSGSGAVGKGRHRRRNQMLPAMMFGVTALGMVLVPIGFQFLAVLSGKALLLAKMALVLASINGLKRIATSGINFGLYQVPDQYNYYDRGDVNRLQQLKFE